MRLLANGFTTAVSTLAGSTAGAGGASTAGTGTYGAGHGLRVQKVSVMSGGTSVAPDGTDGLVGFRYGDSSNAILSTITVCPQPLVVGGAPVGVFQVELDGLDIRCNWFEAITRTTCAGGVGVYIFGE